MTYTGPEAAFSLQNQVYSPSVVLADLGLPLPGTAPPSGAKSVLRFFFGFALGSIG